MNLPKNLIAFAPKYRELIQKFIDNQEELKQFINTDNGRKVHKFMTERISKTGMSPIIGGFNCEKNESFVKAAKQIEADYDLSGKMGMIYMDLKK